MINGLIDLLLLIFFLAGCLFIASKCDCQTEAQKENEVYIKQNCTVITQSIGPVFTETLYKCNDGSTRKVNHF